MRHTHGTGQQRTALAMLCAVTWTATCAKTGTEPGEASDVRAGQRCTRSLRRSFRLTSTLVRRTGRGGRDTAARRPARARTAVRGAGPGRATAGPRHAG
ncbi:hypothetical protein [Streptomyces sp. WAC06614]|uniref:hypothetical protein n=1 Tax=Streptomyces sp. WAC06614 TaxID=2487416 RepID=UPI000F7AEA4E|nr:hypothetical protein [Streptomyces sp. WAC06614]RSS82267.1 hypothetical protein EF918_07465 [Streptomyces sp. WAC06614]